MLSAPNWIGMKSPAAAEGSNIWAGRKLTCGATFRVYEDVRLTFG